MALLVRLIYLFAIRMSEPPHLVAFAYGGETGSIAASIASGKGFSSPLSAPSGPTAWITPVFPYLLAAIFKMFGIFSVKSYYVIRCVNVFFSAATIFPIYFSAKRLFGTATATLSGWIWVFLPAGIYFPVVWVWDMSLAALVVATALWLTLNIEARRGSAWWVLFGCLWGLAILVNAAALTLVVPSVLFALYRLGKVSRFWTRPALLTGLAFALTLAPWIIRNEILFHGQVVLRSNFGLELWLGNNPEVPDSWSWWLHPTGSPKEYAEFFRVGEVAYMREKKQLAWQFIKTHPADVARFQFHRFFQTWTGETDSFQDIWATGSLHLRAEILWNYSLTLFMLFGLLGAYRRDPFGSVPLLSAIVLFPVPYYICHTDPRYRHPIDPVIVMLAALACCQLARRFGILRDDPPASLSASAALS